MKKRKLLKLLIVAFVLCTGLKLGSLTVNAQSITLSKTSATVYGKEGDSYDIEIAFNGLADLTSLYSMDYDCSNDNMYTYCYIKTSDNSFHIFGYHNTFGTNDITFTIGDQVLKFRLITKKISLKGVGDSYLKTGKKKKLSISGYSGKITWKSSNKKIATISSKGVVKAKKEGSVIIYATLSNGTKFGTVINCLSAKRLKIVKRAIYIGKHWKYSQSKRMSNGYYDCSALVWKAYKYGGKKLVSGSYAPTAANIGKWCVKHKKVPKGKVSTNIQKMKYKPGALAFGTGAKNGRYRGIYHVEMFVGYKFGGFDSNGKAYVYGMYANRGYGYGDSTSLMAQPF